MSRLLSAKRAAAGPAGVAPAAALAVALAASLLLLAGCGSPPRTTRLTVDDFREVAAAMAESLARSDALAERDAESEPWFVSIDRVRNLTSDVIPLEEQWAVMAMLRSSLPMQALWRDKKVAFVIPPEQVRRLERELPGEPVTDALREGRRATHTLAATFRSITRGGAETRTDYYYLEFDLFRLGDPLPRWTDRFELKRRAIGRIWD